MSFVYAEKINYTLEDKQIQGIKIYSDTKVSIEGAVKTNWSEQQRKAIEKYGMCKSIIIDPKCCISFAGNNIFLLQKLFDQLVEWGNFEIDQLIEYAYKIHLSEHKDNIEFIICYVDDNDDKRIACIKEKQLFKECQNAWIGSIQTFRKMQELRMQGVNPFDTSYYLFESAVSSPIDDSVGGVIVEVSCGRKNEFFFTGKLISVVEREQKYLPGEIISMMGTAEEGSCSMYFYESQTEVRIDFLQIDFSLLYTSSYRVGINNFNNENIRYFMIPIPIRTSTGTVLNIE